MDMPEAPGPIELPDGLTANAITDPAGLILGFNPTFCERLGLTPRQLHLQALEQLFDEDQRPEVRAVMARAREGITHYVTWPTRAGAGRVIHCEWQIAPRMLRGGATTGLALTLVPVEAQRSEWRHINIAHDRFRSIASGLAAMVWVAGPDGTIRNSNRAWREFLGGDYPSPDVWRLVIHPDDYTEVMSQRSQARADRPPRVFSYRLRRLDGAYRWVEERVTRQDGEYGETLIASCNDVTEQRELRERLELAIAQSEGILNGALDAIVTVDEQNRIIGFNPAAEQLFGYPAREILGHSITRLMPSRFRHGTDRLRSVARQSEIASRVGGVGSGVTGLRADGTEFPMEASVSAVQTPKGRLYTAIIRDVSALVNSMQELTDREQRLRLAMESANLGGAEMDIASGKLIVNEAAARLLGLPPDPAHWTLPNVLAPVHPDDREYVRRTLESIVREDKVRDIEVRIVRPDGEARWVYARGRLYRGPQGEPQRVVGVIMDIHERKKAEQELRRLSQRVLAAQEDERRRIARELHDQIGQALTAAIINVQMLPAGAATAELRDTLGVVLKEVRELSLDLRPSMLDSLGLEPALRWYLDKQAALGRFLVELRCAAEPRLAADTETLVFRLVQEALTNILRHARARRVSVEVERSGEEVVLTVADDGVGFDPAAVQAGAVRGRSFGVLGMRERVELAGGALTFRSEPGQGTTVTAVLPLKGPGLAPPAAPA